MQEVGDDHADGLLVVDEGLQDFCGAACGNKVIGCDRGSCHTRVKRKVDGLYNEKHQQKVI